MKYKLTLFVALVILVLCIIPVPEVPDLANVPFFDKWVHFLMFGSMTGAMYVDRKLTKQDINILFILMAFLIPSFWGGLMELVQAYCTTCRSGDWFDFLADAFGAFLSTIISLILWKIVKILVQK